ncbi:ribonuclease BN (tRNA processing enzyme) [Enterococcus sp. PF1-24]|uniref:MBL fold metallo-hydrolase n=1 Tax=unclassified Enterococcus TaxID=2608891 RepID=UPI0024751649|nr:MULTISPECIES: MBL fold metallo-hydrolase [unclassified Enterococcus]MDH6364578.1 ribonuclease BN (tRNA processing enzyme) [Enterococcus sp. PFB1-1]MDH6401679.1 ribonuclease BN (tRNA processing enzyme) [Enterococcus sp. PF1-24]
MKLTVLGCLGAYPYQNQGTTSFLLQSGDYNLLLDAGSATLVQLEQVLDPLALDAVILSHYHHDHIADLGVLQYYWQLHPKRNPEKILPIYGHTEDLQHFEALTLAGVTAGQEYFEAEELLLGPFLVTFMKTIHPVPCFAMRFVERGTGKVFVFTGDSGYLESFVPFAKEADLFLADTYLFAGNERHHAHFTSKEAGEIALAAKVKKLVLTHLPQFGDLTQLQAEAQLAAGTKIPVELAAVNHSYNI